MSLRGIYKIRQRFLEISYHTIKPPERNVNVHFIGEIWQILTRLHCKPVHQPRGWQLPLQLVHHQGSVAIGQCHKGPLPS